MVIEVLWSTAHVVVWLLGGGDLGGFLLLLHLCNLHAMLTVLLHGRAIMR